MQGQMQGQVTTQMQPNAQYEQAQQQFHRVQYDPESGERYYPNQPVGNNVTEMTPHQGYMAVQNYSPAARAPLMAELPLNSPQSGQSGHSGNSATTGNNGNTESPTTTQPGGSNVDPHTPNTAAPLALGETPANDESSKKKRGRPKKLILDPETNVYIDSSHGKFKKLNKLLKESAQAQKPAESASDGSLMSKGSNIETIKDDVLKDLLKKKDKRGRPRKFPIEETGVTIKGIRVNGSLKARKKASALRAKDSKIEKKKRGRPRKVVPAAAP